MTTAGIPSSRATVGTSSEAKGSFQTTVRTRGSSRIRTAEARLVLPVTCLTALRSRESCGHTPVRVRTETRSTWASTPDS